MMLCNQVQPSVINVRQDAHAGLAAGEQPHVPHDALQPRQNSVSGMPARPELGSVLSDHDVGAIDFESSPARIQQHSPLSGIL